MSPLSAVGSEATAAAVQALRLAQNIVLACHINPDGDALGCLLALGIALEAQGKRVTLLSADGVPENLRFLPNGERVQTTTDRRDFDLAVVVDAGEISRIGTSREAIESAPIVIDIDHHVTPGAFGQIRLLDATAAATAEIVYNLLRALGADLTVPIAQCLMTGLLTDTGSFRFLNVTPRTMAIGGELIAAGATPNTIAECVFENKSWAAQKLLGRALDSMQKTDDGRVVWAVVHSEDYAAFGATDEATEGIIGAVRTVHNTDIALLLREMPTGKIRVSLRARPPADVSVLAAHFGGGGHRLASGCTLDGPLTAAAARLVAEAQRILADTPPAADPACDTPL